MKDEDLIFEETPAWVALKDQSMPDNLDWRNHNGVNYTSWNKNQHIPQYCGSCWAQATTSGLADRFQILLGQTGSYTPVGLSAQYVVNWNAGNPKSNDYDNCTKGGDPIDVWKFAHDTGIVDSSCQQYIASNFEGTPGPLNTCYDCTWPPCPADKKYEECKSLSNPKMCFPTTPNRLYYAKNFYKLSGSENMKRELFQNGPMECSIHATDAFDAYTGGIYHEIIPKGSDLNHSIGVVGWGLDPATQIPYWIGRNSWGTYWGEGGFFRMIMNGNGL